MRRPRRWVWGFLVFLFLVAAAEFAALAWVLPRYAVHAIRHHFGVDARVGRAGWQFPMALVLSDVRLETGWPSVGVYARRIVVKPVWISWAARRIWLRAVEVEQPLVQLSRTAQGTFLWPLPPTAPTGAAGTGPASGQGSAPSDSSTGERGWALSVGTLTLSEGTITFLDERVSPRFYGSMDHLSLVAGPVSWPAKGELMTVALRGELIGHQGHSAPIYCSGWLEPRARDMQTACQLEPLTLAAFEPYYYQGRLQARVYEATLDSTSRWSAKADQLDGRIQVNIKNLTEGDLSVRGTTLVDIKRLSGGESPTLTGEVKVTGPLSRPTQWQLELVPGNEILQRLMKPLVERGREIIQFRLGKETIKMGISPATADVMSGIREASEKVQESLEILTTPLPEEASPGPSAETGVVSQPPPEGSVEPAAPPPLTPSVPAGANPASAPEPAPRTN